MRADEVLKGIQVFEPNVVAVRLVPQRARRVPDARTLPRPAGARLMVPGLEPIVLLSDGQRKDADTDDGR